MQLGHRGVSDKALFFGNNSRDAAVTGGYGRLSYDGFTKMGS